MFIPNFKYHKPQTLNEAFNILQTSSNAAAIAGGTDLLVEIKQGKRKHDDIVSLNDIQELKIIKEIDNFFIIGPAVTHSQIENSSMINKYFPALKKAVATIGSHQIRNTGTIGGNLCTCASCADTAPILLALNAEIEIASTNKSRIVKLSDFLVGHHASILKKGELLIKIIIPKPKSNFGASFEKYGLRESASVSVASVAVSLLVEEEVINQAIVVIGACAPIPMKSQSAMKKLIGCNISELTENSEILDKIGDATASDVLPIDDIRGTADYRRQIVKTLVQRVVLQAKESINVF